MKRYLAATFVLMMLITLAACVTAGGYSYDGGNIPERIDNQQRRIDAGVSDGSLNRGEAAIVQDNLDWIRREFSRARANGSVSRDEYMRIERHLDQNSQMIHNKRNNPIRRMY